MLRHRLTLQLLHSLTSLRLRRLCLNEIRLKHLALGRLLCYLLIQSLNARCQLPPLRDLLRDCLALRIDRGFLGLSPQGHLQLFPLRTYLVMLPLKAKPTL